MPGHTLVTFPESIDAILAGGHELACHGWYHEDFAELEPDVQGEILRRSVEAVRARTGAAPAGHRAPYWSLGPGTLALVEATGFVYDSSLMSGDYGLARVRHGDRHSVVDGTIWGEPGTPGRGPRLLGPRRLADLRAAGRARWARGAVTRSSRSGSANCGTRTRTRRAASSP